MMESDILDLQRRNPVPKSLGRVVCGAIARALGT